MSDNKSVAKVEQTAVPGYSRLMDGYLGALKSVDDIVLKHYVTKLTDLEVVPLEKPFLASNVRDNVRFFKITEMVYEKDEFAPYKFASVFNSLAAMRCAVFVIIDSDGASTDFYMGIRSFDPDRTTNSLNETLGNAMSGQFPGIKTEAYTSEEIQDFLGGLSANSVSAVSCVANIRNENLNKNAEFVQGLEKLVLSLQGKRYTGIIIANTTGQEQLRALRKGYEEIYAQLAPFVSMQVNYGQNFSQGKNEAVADGTNVSETTTSSRSRAEGRSETRSNSATNGTSKSTAHSWSNSESHQNGVGILTKALGSVAVGLGATALAPITGGLSIGGAIGLIGAGAGVNVLGSFLGKQISDSTSKTTTEGVTSSRTVGTTSGENFTNTVSESTGNTRGTSRTVSAGTNMSAGLTNAITLTTKDKYLEDLLQRLDKQLQRIDSFESLGMFECAAYFMSGDRCTAEMAATTYKAIVAGENTGVEVAAINSWGAGGGADTKKVGIIAQYVKNFVHPVFKYRGALGNMEVTTGALVSGNELAIHMGLPRKSVCGLPVIEHSEFGQEVVSYNGAVPDCGIKLGKVFNMGRACPNDVVLDKDSLAMHAFVTGATGSGKSNTVFSLIGKCQSRGVKFLIVEPVKGEYKHVFGTRGNVHVYGSNPDQADLLRINPFRFPAGLHVLEHIDRLVEIFNVCWPMYAAMPAVLKDALLKAYEDCGWDFATSTNRYGGKFYPTFADLKQELVEVIEKSSYSAEVKSNYMGSLVTRVNSLTNGLNGQIFSFAEIGDRQLFDSNVIVDLSRIGSVETKSLIMGVLVLKLSEYRLASAEDFNVPLKHVTILEEAHNILKRTSTEQNPENPSLIGKSVEMIANAIAEMRTYGEGFIIVDQSPSAVDASAIRNTGTKIIMRLPDEADRRLAGKAAGLKDEQLDEIAKLPKGVAVVYQNDWVEAVLCQIDKFSGPEGRFTYQKRTRTDQATPRLKKKLLELLLKTRVKGGADIDVAGIRDALNQAELDSRTRIAVTDLVAEYARSGALRIWGDERFAALAKVVANIFHSPLWIDNVYATASNFEDVTRMLMDKVKQQAPEVANCYALAAAQCFLKHAARESVQKQEVYARWISELRSGVIDA